LELDHKESFKKLLDCRFDIIRLCVYWDEVQSGRNTLDLSLIKQELDACEGAGQEVVVAIGMKAPRWPEYYIPDWAGKTPMDAEKFILPFVERTIKELQQHQCIRYWQIENEPLDPSGPDNYTIGHEILKREVDTVKKLDTRLCLVTLWGNELKSRGFMSMIDNMADIVGVDLYYKCPKKDGYSSPEDIAADLRHLGKPLWITELQAEPWENDEAVKMSLQTPSITAELLQENYEKVLEFQPEAVLFWGFEYWLWREKMGDDSLWNKVREILQR
jgi:hypothetical protein